MSKTNIFKVLSDRRRRDILVMLKDGRKKCRGNRGGIRDFAFRPLLSSEITEKC